MNTQPLTAEAIETRRQYNRAAYRKKATLTFKPRSADEIMEHLASVAAAELVEVPGGMAELRDIVRPQDIALAVGKHRTAVYKWIGSGVLPPPNFVLIGSPGRRTGYGAATAERIALILGEHFSKCAYIGPRHEITKRRLVEAMAQ